MQWDDIPAIRRRWHTFGGLETGFAEQTERATRNAKEAGLDDALSFHVADARTALREAGGRYDVVLALDSLHHFSHLGEITRLTARALGPGGLLIMDEYVGPSRFHGEFDPRRTSDPMTDPR